MSICLDPILQSIFDLLLSNRFSSTFAHIFIVDNDGIIKHFQGRTFSGIGSWEKPLSPHRRKILQKKIESDADNNWSHNEWNYIHFFQTTLAKIQQWYSFEYTRVTTMVKTMKLSNKRLLLNFLKLYFLFSPKIVLFLLTTNK